MIEHLFAFVAILASLPIGYVVGEAARELIVDLRRGRKPTREEAWNAGLIGCLVFLLIYANSYAFGVFVGGAA